MNAGRGVDKPIEEGDIPMPDLPAHDPMKLEHAQDALDRLAQVEEQFAQAQDGLEHMQRLATLGTLSAMVAHEFNNILASIICYSQMALTNPDDAVLTRKALKKALSGAQRAEKIATSLLDFSREEQTQAHTPLNQAVEAVFSYLTRSLDQDRIRLRLDIEDVSVAMPAVSLEQVLLNLIVNARKAMQQQGGTLQIRAWSAENMVHIDLSDTGRGVPPQIADRLFEPFITHDPTPNPESDKGTGLGLSICKDLVTKAQGMLSFESTPGQGTTFHIQIPQSKTLRQSA